jgi:hypothetical protein
MLIGLNGTGQKGALLFGNTWLIHSFRSTKYRLQRYISSGHSGAPCQQSMRTTPVTPVATRLVGIYHSPRIPALYLNSRQKKSTINSMTLVSFAVGNIIGTQIFQPSDAPGNLAQPRTAYNYLLGVCPTAYIPGKVAIMGNDV